MKKKTMLLALAAVSAAMLALPAMASALEPLHLNPTPKGAKEIHGGVGVLSTTGGTTITCNTVGGSATFNAGGTTGTMELTFTGDCRESIFNTTCRSTGQVNGTITTTELPFDLVTLNGTEEGVTPPGVLVTPNASGAFAHVICAGGLVTFTVDGNGVIGTIEQKCDETSERADIDFNATKHGQQEHKTVKGTETEYDLTKDGETAAQDATGTVTFKENIKLECS